MFKESNVLELFFEAPAREFNIREVGRILKISPATASTKLGKLARQGLLKERKERMLKLYRANLENDSYRDLKLHHNIRKIKKSGLLDALNRFYLKPAVVLFGSAAYGEDIETSDFDLLVVSEKTKEFPDTRKFEKKLNRKLQIFAVKDARELRNENLINNALNGIIIQGRIKWI